jgi:alkanesulfonate monooxygenase SsuD/methylene tetrahydromethanopterin reductase-like flavin-dependent oxidoreductase (luciferase family)
MVGGRGERMLRLTARYADLWNVWLAFGRNRPEELAPWRAAVDAACRAAGRDPASVERTAAIMVDPVGRPDGPVILARADLAPEPVAGTPAELAAALRAFAGEGLTHIQVHLHPHSLAGVEAFAPVLEALDGPA